MTFTRPQFQPQNPAYSDYALGWSSCTAFSAAMAAAYDRKTTFVMSGGNVRALTGDYSGGLTLAQVDGALNKGWGINLSTVYRYPWADFAKRINAGQAAILQGWYGPIADSRFDAGRGFRGNHAVTVLPTWIAMDPLADGRATGVYRYHAEPYPQSLLRDFAGRLNLGTATSYSPLGQGYVYASFTRDNIHTYALRFTRGSFWVYRVTDGVITGRYSKRFSTLSGSETTSAPCYPPKSTPWPGNGNRNLCYVTKGALAGQWVAVPQFAVSLEVIP